VTSKLPVERDPFPLKTTSRNVGMHLSSKTIGNNVCKDFILFLEDNS